MIIRVIDFETTGVPGGQDSVNDAPHQIVEKSGMDDEDVLHTARHYLTS